MMMSMVVNVLKMLVVKVVFMDMSMVVNVLNMLVVKTMSWLPLQNLWRCIWA